MRVLVLLFGCVLCLTGCAAVTLPTCTSGYLFAVSPKTATVDHSAMLPANQQKFQSTLTPVALRGCSESTAALTALPVWQNPDPLNISISSAENATNGLATCTGTTVGAVTLTAVATSGLQAFSETVQLTCR